MPHAYTENQLVEQAAIGLFVELTPICQAALSAAGRDPGAAAPILTPTNRVSPRAGSCKARSRATHN
jgi:hypothetical protein